MHEFETSTHIVNLASDLKVVIGWKRERYATVGIVALFNMINEGTLKKLKYGQRLTVSASTVAAIIITLRQSDNQLNIEEENREYEPEASGNRELRTVK
jgi:hypothetical protein